MRLFTALVPPTAVLDHLEQALDHVIPPREGQRNPRLPRSSWHITLAFFGQVPAGYIPQLSDDFYAAAARHTPFRLELTGAGTFGGRQAWIGVGGETDELSGLVKDVTGLWHYGEADEPAPPASAHRPHLTFSRLAARADLTNPLRALSVYRGPTWSVTRATLFESRLGQGPGGRSLYVPLAEAPLAAPLV
ncbi:MAG: RNA 2',3'-cyclic phosphodiesterase [Propionibacteriaceae bacterium]|jgi:2'-5' RNA ligase|nr:RNA 2',3'-cyclic phosphodiesterase [Propionibacteriaceae bacterium]